jgi:hypothetical protein
MFAYQKISLTILGLLTLAGPLAAQHARFANAYSHQPTFHAPVYMPQQMFYGYPPQRTLTGFPPVVENSIRNLQAAYAQARQPKLPVVTTPVARFARQPARTVPPRWQPPQPKPPQSQPPLPASRGERSGGSDKDDSEKRDERGNYVDGK